MRRSNAYMKPYSGLTNQQAILLDYLSRGDAKHYEIMTPSLREVAKENGLGTRGKRFLKLALGVLMDYINDGVLRLMVYDRMMSLLKKAKKAYPQNTRKRVYVAARAVALELFPKKFYEIDEKLKQILNISDDHARIAWFKFRQVYSCNHRLLLEVKKYKTFMLAWKLAPEKYRHEVIRLLAKIPSTCYLKPEIAVATVLYIISRRHKLGITRWELALKLGVSEDSIGKLIGRLKKMGILDQGYEE